MADWHRSRTASIGLRLFGLALCALACAVLARLFGHGHAEDAAFGLAAIGFLAGSVGATCAALGGHLFDPVETSARWRRTTRARP